MDERYEALSLFSVDVYFVLIFIADILLVWWTKERWKNMSEKQKRKTEKHGKMIGVNISL